MRPVHRRGRHRFLMKNVINLGSPKNKAMFAKVPAVEEDQK